MIYFKKRLISVIVLGLVLLIWWLVSTPAHFDLSKELSLVQSDADYPIMVPVAIPQDPKAAVFLLVIVSSAPSGISVERRKTIRSTWGKMPPDAGRKWHLIFMTGKTGDIAKDKELFEESKIYGDIFICDYKDDYSKIINKLLAVYKWADSVQERYKFQYVLKTDDDVYVSIPRLYEWIDTVGSKLQYVYAGVLYSGDVTRDKNHRHFVSKEQLPYDYYPVFCKGSMQLLSASLVPEIVKLSKKIQRIIPDDAYVGLIMNELKIKATRMKGLVQQALMRHFLKVTGPCFFKNVIGVGDSLTIQQIWDLHLIITSTPKDNSLWICVTQWFMFLVIVSLLLLIIYYRYRGKISILMRRRRVHEHQ